MSKKRTTISLPPSIYASAQTEALDLGLNFSALISMVLALRYERGRPKTKPAPRKDEPR